MGVVTFQLNRSLTTFITRNSNIKLIENKRSTSNQTVEYKYIILLQFTVFVGIHKLYYPMSYTPMYKGIRKEPT